MRLKIKDPFLKKFEDRCEKIGDGGIFNVPLKHSIIKNDSKKVIKENLKNVNKKQSNIISMMRNQYNSLTLNEYNKIPMMNNKNNEKENTKANNNLNKNIFINQNEKNFDNINNNKNLNIINNSDIENKNEKLYLKKPNNNKSFSNNNRYNSIFNNNDNQIKKNNVINERFYKPYSLKDYKIMVENYKKDRFGGLGINMDKDWKKRQQVYNKVKSFENSVFKIFNKKMNEYNIRKIENPQKVELMRIKQQIMNSKRFLAQKYGKGVMLNKIREKKRKEREEFKMILRYKNERHLMNNRLKNNVLNDYDNVINNNKEKYKMKLLGLKSSLI